MMKTLCMLPLLAMVSLYTASVANAQDGLIANGRDINGRAVKAIDLNNRNLNE